MRLKRAALVVCGLVLALAALEIALRVASWDAERRMSALGGGDSSDSGACRILALGESTTAPVIGADGKTDYSWPAQLQRLLEKRHPGRAFEVINKGRPSTTSAAIVATLPDYLERYRPRIAITMMGVNDARWFGIVKFRQGFTGLLERALAPLKSWKLARHLFYEVYRPGWLRMARQISEANRPPEPPSTPELERCRRLSSPNDPDPAESERACREQIRRVPGDPRPYDELAVHNRDHEAALAARLRGSRNPFVYMMLAGNLDSIERRDEARAMFRACVAYARADRNDSLVDWCTSRGEAMTYAQERRYRAAERSFMEGIRVHEDWRWKSVSIERAEVGAGEPTVTAANYRLLAHLLHKYGAPLIAMQYAREDAAELKDTLRESPDATIVDNKPAFDRELVRGRYGQLFVDRFSGSWGHCTERGNALIAENAARALEPILARVCPAGLGR